MGKREDTLVKVVLVFFLSLISFSVGTYIGKTVADHDAMLEQQQMDNWCAKARAETECTRCPECPQADDRKPKIKFKLVEE